MGKDLPYEKEEALKKYGKSKPTVDLIAEKRKDLIQYLPGVTTNKNSTDPNEPNKTPANKIDNSTSSQGLGTVPGIPATSSKSSVGGGEEGENDSTNKELDPTSALRTGGDPLILFSGQFYHQVTDLEVKARGLHFSFIRTYLNQTIYKGPLGYNWDHSYNLWLREEQEIQPDGSKRNVVYRSNGQLREDPYTQIVDIPVEDSTPPLSNFTDATFQPPLGIFDRLEKSDGTYILQTVEGVRFYYNNDLYVERIVDPNGNQMQFEYQDLLLIRITDPVGKKFEFEYDEMRRIQTLNDVIGNRRIKYFYGDNGDLEEVDAIVQDAEFVSSTDYRYLGPNHPFELQHNLIEIINPIDGQSTIENEYGVFPGTLEFNRIIRQRAEDGEYQYEYSNLFESPINTIDIFDINTPLTQTRVIYPNDHSIDFTFNNQGNVISKSEQIIVRPADIPRIITTAYRYNKDGLVIEETRPDQSRTEYRYQREEYEDKHDDDALNASPIERLAFGNLVRKVITPKPLSKEDNIRLVTEYFYETVLLTGGSVLKSSMGPNYTDLFFNILPNQPDREVTYKYDEVGNLVEIHYSNVKKPDGTIQTPSPILIKYNGHGSITDVNIGPLHSQYGYFADEFRSAFIKEFIEDVEGIGRVSSFDTDNLGRVTQIKDHFGAITNIGWTGFDTPRKITHAELFPGKPRPSTFYAYDKNRNVKQILEEVVLPDGSAHPEGLSVQYFTYDTYSRIVEQVIGSYSGADTSTSNSIKKSKTKIWRTVYTPFNLPDREIDFNGNTTSYSYNERMLVSTITMGLSTPDETTRRVVYDESGNVISIIDGRNFETIIHYDGFGRVHKLITPEGTERILDYDSAGNIVRDRLFGPHPDTQLLIRWQECEYEYDGLNRLINRIEHLFNPDIVAEPSQDSILETHYIFDSLNRLVSIMKSNHVVWSYQYDGLGRLIKILDADGNQIEWRYDDSPASHMVTIVSKEIGKDELNSEIIQVFKHQIKYNNRSLLIEEIDGLGNSIKREYDSRNLLCQIANPLGHFSMIEYNILGRPVSYKTQLSPIQTTTTDVSYDDNDNVTSIVTPISGEIEFSYDVLNRIKTITREKDHVISYTYDKESNLISQLDENGIIINRTFTPTGYLQKVQTDASKFFPIKGLTGYTPSSVSNVEYKFTPTGSLHLAKNKTAEVMLRYNSLDQAIEEVCNGQALRYEYDSMGFRSKLVFPGFREIEYSYSLAGNLNNIFQENSGISYPGDSNAEPSRTLASIWYIGSRPTVIRLGNCFKKLSYDLNKRIVGVDWFTKVGVEGSSTILFEERNLYGSMGEWRVHQTDTELRLSDYDLLTRLIKRKDFEVNQLLIDTDIYSPPPSETGLNESVDQNHMNGNIKSIEDGLINTTPTRSYIYHYDENGNRLETENMLKVDNQGAADVIKISYMVDKYDRYQSIDNQEIIYDRVGNLLFDGQNKYRYDPFNRLTEIDTSSGQKIKLSYDALDRRFEIQYPDHSLGIIYSGYRIVEGKMNGNLQGQMIPMDAPGEYAHLAFGGKDMTPLVDMMNSLVGVADLDGNLFTNKRRKYDPFGQIIDHTDDSTDDLFSLLGFAGTYYDVRSGVYHLPGRSYNPRIGRFLQKDPMGFIDDVNLYSYSKNAPGTFVDYWGYNSKDIVDWKNIAWEGIKSFGKTVVKGVGGVVGGALIAPWGLLGYAAAWGLKSSYDERSAESIAAGKTDYQLRSITAAAGDIIGLTNIGEAITGRDFVSGNTMNPKERARRAGAGAGSALLTAAMGRIFKIYGVRGATFGANAGGNLAIQRAITTQALSHQEPLQRFPAVLAGNRVFRHFMTGVLRFKNYASIERSGTMKLSQGSTATYGPGVYAYPEPIPAKSMKYIDIQVPPNTAVETIKTPKGETFVRLIPPEGDVIPVKIISSNLTPEEKMLGHEMLNRIK